MATKAEQLRMPPNGWGRAGRLALRSILAISLVAGASVLSAEPVEADAARAGQLAPAASEQESATRAVATQAPTAPVSSMSVSAFSATQTKEARVLLAAELGSESATSPARPSSPVQPRVGTAAERESEAEAREAQESAIVGRSLRAYTRDQEELDGTESPSPRRRAAFSSAISRAAASGALTSANPNASIGSALNSSRFMPGSGNSQFDPGFSQAADVLSIVPGLRLESATIFAGYSSNAVPRSLESGGYGFRDANLGADYDLGASAVIRYSHNGRRSLTQFSYTGSHIERSRIPEWSTTEHVMSFATSRDLTPRLSIQATTHAGDTGLEQFWTRQPVIRRVDAPANINELISKVLSGEITDDEFAAILTGSPVVDDPGGAQQDLSRIFSLSVGTTASYAYSRRLTLNFGASSSANQLIGGDLQAEARGSRYVQFARTSNANASADYRLSSRTRISLSHVTRFTNSSLAESVSQNPSVSVNQVLSRHWTYQVGAGVGMIHFDRGHDYENGTTWTANGTLGYNSGPHFINLTAGKSVGDPLGLGSRSTVQANLSWNWQPRFSPWGATAGVAFSRSDYSGDSLFGREFMSDLYSLGMSRRLTASTSFRTDYYYGSYVSPYSGVTSNMALHRLQMSLVWRPVEPR